MKDDWRKKNPEKVRAYERKRWRDSTKRKADGIRAQNHRIALSDSYIRELVTKKSETLRPKDLSNEFIKAYRLNLKLKRALGLTPPIKLKSST